MCYTLKEEEMIEIKYLKYEWKITSPRYGEDHGNN